jgi:hypothetical protein
VFASATLTEHLIRGSLAVSAVVGSLPLFAAGTLMGAVGGILALGFALVMMRGCPMCWTMGLLETISATRNKRGCEQCSARPDDPKSPGS